MKVIFTARPAYGHVYPLMPLAMAFRQRGDEVIFGTGNDPDGRGDSFVSRLEALGFEAHSVGKTIGWAWEIANASTALQDLDPQRRNLILGRMLFAELLPPHTAQDLEGLVAKVEPDLIVYEMSDFGAGIAAGLTGTPCAVHSFGKPWPDMMLDAVRPELLKHWRSHGYEEPPVDVATGNVYLDISPPSMGDASGIVPDRLSLRPVPFSEAIGEVPSWIAEDRVRPVVYVTLGTVMYGAVDVIRAAVDGLAQLDVDVLVTVGPNGDVDALGELPSRVHAERFVPQDRLLPLVDLVVHHCGSGTTLGALANGLPQVAMPQGADQFENAEALAKAGAGIALMTDEMSGDAVRDAAEKVLGDPSYRQAAQRSQAEIEAMPAPAEVAETLAARFG